MNNWICKGILPTIVFVLTLGVTARADEHACSNATIKGRYGFTMSGPVYFPMGTVQRDGVAMARLDGAGNITLVPFALNNGVPAVTFAQIPGTYSVNADCTGSGHFDFPGQLVKFTISLSKQGTIIHALVYELVQEGLPNPVPAAVHGEGEKFGPLDNDHRDDHDNR